MLTSLIRVAAPAALPIDRETVFAHLRSLIDDGETEPDDADYIDALIEMIVSRLDGPQGMLNRALITQSWQLNFDAFPAEIAIPLGRCSEVSEVVYLDSDGEEQTLAPSTYRVTGIGTDNCRVRPVNGTSWPATYRDPEAVAVLFKAGFGATADDVPGTIRHAILEMVSRAYEFSEPIVSGTIITPVPGSAAAAIADWRVWPNE